MSHKTFRFLRDPLLLSLLFFQEMQKFFFGILKVTTGKMKAAYFQKWLSNTYSRDTAKLNTKTNKIKVQTPTEAHRVTRVPSDKLNVLIIVYMSEGLRGES